MHWHLLDREGVADGTYSTVASVQRFTNQDDRQSPCVDGVAACSDAGDYGRQFRCTESFYVATPRSSLHERVLSFSVPKGSLLAGVPAEWGRRYGKMVYCLVILCPRDTPDGMPSFS